MIRDLLFVPLLSDESKLFMFFSFFQEKGLTSVLIAGDRQAFEILIKEAMLYDDELFHYFMFDWFRECNWIDRLLMVIVFFLNFYTSYFNHG